MTNVLDITSKIPKQPDEDTTTPLGHYGPPTDFLLFSFGMALDLAKSIAWDVRNGGKVEGIFVHTLLEYLEETVRGVFAGATESAHVSAHKYTLEENAYEVWLRTSPAHVIRKSVEARNKGEEVHFEGVWITASHFQLDSDKPIRPGGPSNPEHIEIPPHENAIWSEQKIRKVIQNMVELTRTAGGFTSVLDNVFRAFIPNSPKQCILLSADFHRPILLITNP